MKVYSPEGQIGQVSIQAAAPLSTLAGQRVGVLDNGKPGAQLILEQVAKRLGERTQTEFIGHFRKRTAATPCDEALIEQIAAEADFVLTGIAD